MRSRRPGRREAGSERQAGNRGGRRRGGEMRGTRWEASRGGGYAVGGVERRRCESDKRPAPTAEFIRTRFDSRGTQTCACFAAASHIVCVEEGPAPTLYCMTRYMQIREGARRRRWTRPFLLYTACFATSRGCDDNYFIKKNSKRVCYVHYSRSRVFHLPVYLGLVPD